METGPVLSPKETTLERADFALELKPPVGREKCLLTYIFLSALVTAIQRKPGKSRA